MRALLADPSAESFARFAEEYRATLQRRFAEDREPFDQLAHRAQLEDVYLGCNCPTRSNPDVRHCHTVLALEFMKKKYPQLTVRFPAPAGT